MSDFKRHFTPALGAAPESVTVPVELAPPTTLVGASWTLDKVGGKMARVAEADLPPAVAVRVAEVFAATGMVEILTVAVDVPVATTRLDGVLAEVEELLRVTVIPLVGAFPDSVTVPTAPVPPSTLAGVTEKL